MKVYKREIDRSEQSHEVIFQSIGMVRQVGRNENSQEICETQHVQSFK